MSWMLFVWWNENDEMDIPDLPDGCRFYYIGRHGIVFISDNKSEMMNVANLLGVRFEPDRSPGFLKLRDGKSAMVINGKQMKATPTVDFVEW